MLDVTCNLNDPGALDFDSVEVKVNKNANSLQVYNGGSMAFISSTGYIQQMTLSGTFYISCNGTDAITVVIQPNFTVAQLAGVTSMRLVAI